VIGHAVEMNRVEKDLKKELINEQTHSDHDDEENIRRVMRLALETAATKLARRPTEGAGLEEYGDGSNWDAGGIGSKDAGHRRAGDFAPHPRSATQLRASLCNRLRLD